MSLTSWLEQGRLRSHRTSRREISDLIEVVDRDIESANTPALSTDWRFNIAYNAVLQTAMAALAAEGYRPGRQAHHHWAIQSLAFTLGLPEKEIRLLDAYRKKRNLVEYERAGVVTDTELAELMESAREIRDRLLEWLRDRHAEFLP